MKIRLYACSFEFARVCMTARLDNPTHTHAKHTHMPNCFSMKFNSHAQQHIHTVSHIHTRRWRLWRGHTIVPVCVRRECRLRCYAFMNACSICNCYFTHKWIHTRLAAFIEYSEKRAHAHTRTLSTNSLSLCFTRCMQLIWLYKAGEYIAIIRVWISLYTVRHIDWYANNIHRSRAMNLPLWASVYMYIRVYVRWFVWMDGLLLPPIAWNVPTIQYHTHAHTHMLECIGGK